MKSVKLNGHDFIEIPEGISCIGSDALDPYASDKERPLREVFISTFWISKYPTTILQFYNYLKSTRRNIPSNWGKMNKKGMPHLLDKYEDYPVTNVSWEMAVEYCVWLRNLSEKNVVLPTEAEWEKAARGEDAKIWPWGNSFNAKFCNSMESGRNSTCSVYEYKEGASPYGVMHMSGNVWEWCQDFWHPISHDEIKFINPVNFKPSGRRVVKGGSAFCTKEVIRPACRDWTNSVNQGGGDDGFRVAIRLF